MSTRNEAPGLRFHDAAAPDRPYWSTTQPLPAGLAISVQTVDSDQVLAVTTVKRYVPAGTHAPVQVQATYALSDARPAPLRFSAQWVYGAREPLPAELLDQVTGEVGAAVTAVVATAPSFAAEWDALRARSAAAASQHTDDQVVRVAAAAAMAFAALGVPADAERLAADPRVRALVAEHACSDAPSIVSGGEATDRLVAALGADARVRLEATERLSELEFTALLAETLTAHVDGMDAGLARRAASVSYDVCHSVYYGTAGFPDRAHPDTPVSAR